MNKRWKTIGKIIVAIVMIMIIMALAIQEKEVVDLGKFPITPEQCLTVKAEYMGKQISSVDLLHYNKSSTTHYFYRLNNITHAVEYNPTREKPSFRCLVYTFFENDSVFEEYRDLIPNLSISIMEIYDNKMVTGII